MQGSIMFSGQLMTFTAPVKGRLTASMYSYAILSSQSFTQWDRKLSIELLPSLFTDFILKAVQNLATPISHIYVHLPINYAHSLQANLLGFLSLYQRF